MLSTGVGWRRSVGQRRKEGAPRSPHLHCLASCPPTPRHRDPDSSRFPAGTYLYSVLPRALCLKKHCFLLPALLPQDILSFSQLQLSSLKSGNSNARVCSWESFIPSSQTQRLLNETSGRPGCILAARHPPSSSPTDPADITRPRSTLEHTHSRTLKAVLAVADFGRPSVSKAERGKKKFWHFGTRDGKRLRFR